MKLATIATALCLLGATSTLFSADEWPLTKLKEAGTGDSPLGAWSLAAFGGRDDGYLVDRADLKNGGGGQWALPNPEAGKVSIDGENLNIRSIGMRNDASIDSLLAALVIAPKKAGNYALSGKMSELWCDNDDGKDSLTWAVYRGLADGKKFKLVVTGATGKGETVDLGASEELKGVALAADETMVLTLFKKGHWGAGGGNLTGISIDKVAAKP